MIPVREKWLRQKYETEHLSCPAIALLVQRDPKTVWSWLRAYGIPTRPRGMNNRFTVGQTSAFKGRKHSEETKRLVRERRLKDGHFPKQPDGRPYWSGKNGEEHPTWRGGATPERQAFYASSEWRDARKIAYQVAHGMCQRCSAKCNLHVHHIIPFLVARTRAAIWNLRVLCTPCHRFVHSRTNVDREYLPVFGVIYTQSRPIRISYNAKHVAEIPSWMR